MPEIHVHPGHRILLILFCLPFLASCSEPTAIVLEISQSAAVEPPLQSPDDVDKLTLVVSVDSRQVVHQDFRLSGPSRILAESVTLRPGPVGNQTISIEVTGSNNQATLLFGALETAFSPDRETTRNIQLDFTASACVDLDSDEYGRGPGCRDTDCDDHESLVNAGMDELCDGWTTIATGRPMTWVLRNAS